MQKREPKGPQARELCPPAARLAKFSKEKILCAKAQAHEPQAEIPAGLFGFAGDCTRVNPEQGDRMLFFPPSISRHRMAELRGDGSELRGCSGACTWESVSPNSVKTLTELSLLDVVLLLFCSPEICYG